MSLYKKTILEHQLLRPRSKTYSTKDYLKILSPFDNAVIHREKLKAVFGFDYKIECYTPKEKRVFGYFSLPILFNDVLVARVDCKAHRKEGILEIIHLHCQYFKLIEKELQYTLL